MKKTVINNDNLEVRMAEPSTTMADSNTVFGRAISYEVESDNLRFTEIIHRGAVTDELLKNSDVYCRVNHSDDYIVARSNRGKGSLHLENRADGLYYSFEVPNTEKGRELAEHIRRGEITSSSFSFVVDADGETWSKRNGRVYHEVNRIAYLHDVAPVYLPAYNSSSCSMRAAEILDEMEKEEDTNAVETTAENKAKRVIETTTTETNTVTTVTKEVEEIAEKTQENDNTNDVVNGNTVNLVGDSEDNEQRAADEEEVKKDDDEQETEEQTEEVNEETTEQVEETQEIEQTTTEEENTENTTEEDEEDKINNRNITDTMNKTKKFSIVNAINAVVANRPLDAVSEAVNRAGQADLTGAKMGYTGQITLPLSQRDAISVDTEGELVGVEVWDIMSALYGNNVLTQAGARVLDNLTSDVVLPQGNPASVFWEGEDDEAQDANITFSSVKLQPKRICATTLISKKLLIQTSDSVEAYVRQTIIDALRAKIEETVLGDAAGTTEKPAGVRYGKTPVEVADFADLVDAEAEVTDLVSNGNNVYILSNKAKAALRAMTKGQGNGLVLEGGEVDGTAAFVTSHIGTGKNYVYGDFSTVVIGNFGAVDIVVEQEPKFGAVRLTLNAYVDVAYTNSDAIIAGEITEE